jgi:hypothetical protein
MATQYSDNYGRPVALRTWGGETEGVAIRLLPGAANVEATTRLFGEDGTTATLHSLALEAGKGGFRERLAQSTAAAPDSREARCWSCGDDLYFASEKRRQECNGCERDRCED